jgi:repressor LexA
MKPGEMLDIPIVGRVAAGEPIMAEEHLEGSIRITRDLFPRGSLFALRVQGDSMVEVGINRGDLAVVRQQPDVDNAQIAAVQRGNEATLKRWYAYPDHIRLKAENDAVADICVQKGHEFDVRVVGLYVGLIRPAR